MHRRRRFLRIALGLMVAFGIAATRSEKLFAESLTGLPHAPMIVMPQDSGIPFDPRRVPQSGGMASRLLAGIAVKPPAV